MQLCCNYVVCQLMQCNRLCVRVILTFVMYAVMSLVAATMTAASSIPSTVQYCCYSVHVSWGRQSQTENKNTGPLSFDVNC